MKSCQTKLALLRSGFDPKFCQNLVVWLNFLGEIWFFFKLPRFWAAVGWHYISTKPVNGFTYELHVTTMVDPVTGWFEHQQILDSIWSSCYFCSKEIIYNNGSEFKMEFKDLCSNMGLKRCPNNAWNPQSNAILEQIHQVLADSLVTFKSQRNTYQFRRRGLIWWVFNNSSILHN